MRTLTFHLRGHIVEINYEYIPGHKSNGLYDEPYGATTEYYITMDGKPFNRFGWLIDHLINEAIEKDMKWLMAA